MGYAGKKVFIVSDFVTGEIVREENGKYLVRFKNREAWFPPEELRLWTEEIDEACGNNRKCWTICGKKLD
jgi:hypothetical protein